MNKPNPNKEIAKEFFKMNSITSLVIASDQGKIIKINPINRHKKAIRKLNKEKKILFTIKIHPNILLQYLIQ